MDEILEELLPPAEKLGITPGTKVIVIDAPPDIHVILGRLPRKCYVVDKLEYNADYIHLFATEKKTLEKIFPQLKKSLYERGMIWVSWPKASSGVKTDLDEDAVRDIGLASDLVDVKLVSLGDTWSALKFTYRIKDRPVKLNNPDEAGKKQNESSGI
jgi:hypothetical protein